MSAIQDDDANLFKSGREEEYSEKRKLLTDVYELVEGEKALEALMSKQKKDADDKIRQEGNELVEFCHLHPS